MSERQELIIAIPAGPQIPGESRHSEGSRLAEPTHRLLRDGAGLKYTLYGRQLTGLIVGTNWRLMEFRGSDIPSAVADGDADVGFTTLDKVLNLPNEEFDKDGELKHIEIMRELGYGGCEYRLGIPVRLAIDLGYPVDPADIPPGFEIDAKLDVASNRVVGLALEHLARRIFEERKITPADFIVRDGHVENTVLPPRGRADVIVDIYETGGTMRENKIIPAKEQLMLFQAVQIRRKAYLGRNADYMLERFDSRIARAIENPDFWMLPIDKRLPEANPDFRVPRIPGIKRLNSLESLAIAV